MLRTPEEAAETLCPLARTFGDKDAVKGCRGSSCMVWRWEKITTAHPAWQSAVARHLNGGVDPDPGQIIPMKKVIGREHREIVALIAADKEAYGLVPTRGFCGIGGEG